MKAKELVLEFLKAMNIEDFNAARDCVNPDMQFDGVLGARTGADAYFKDMEKMKMKYDIKKIFEDGEDVCVLYEIPMAGNIIFTCGWYQLVNNKIQRIKVVFDPRPVLEGQKK